MTLKRVEFIIYYLAVFIVVQPCALTIAFIIAVFGDKDGAKEFLKDSDIFDLYNIKLLKKEWNKK